MQMKALANSVNSQKKKFLHKIPSRLTEGRPSSDSEASVIAYVGAAVFMHHVGKL